MVSDSTHRTLVLSVVAVDLVGYSLKSVAEQISLKAHLNQVLLKAICDIPIADRIILDTGDGVAMGFLGDPEDALYVAMFMHQGINRDDAGGLPGDINSGNAVRIGINLGPVKLATGVGGHPNIIGDGINVAERIMTFAEPGQLTASRPFFELMSRMSESYATLFHFSGVHTDKQVRAHDVYLVAKSVTAIEQAARGVAERAAQRTGKPAIPPAPPAPGPVAPPPAKGLALLHTGTTPGDNRAALIDFLENRTKVVATATILAALVLALGTLLIYRKMAVIPMQNTVPGIIAMSPAPANKNNGLTAAPVPAVPAVSTNGPASAAPKAEAKPATASATTPPAAAAPPAGSAAGATTTKVSDRPTSPAGADRSDKTAGRAESRGDPRKTGTPRTVPRDQGVPATAAPAAPAQTVVEPPPPELSKPAQPIAPTPNTDTSVTLITRIEPSYPVEGIRQGIHKTVVVKARLVIGARGNVNEVTILEGGPIAAFGRQTRTTLKEWKFNSGAPGRTFDVEISFKP